MAFAETGGNLSGLAQVLVLEGLLNEEAAKFNSKRAKDEKMPLVDFLVERDLVSAHAIAAVCSRNFGVPILDLDCFDETQIPLDLVNEKLVHRHHVLPLYRRGDTLFLAVADPSRQIAIDEIKFQTGLNTKCIVVETHKLTKRIEHVLTEKQSAALGNCLDETNLDQLNIVIDDDGSNEKSSDVTDDAPIVRLVNKVLLDAIKGGASDIHFEPYENLFRIRFRIDGILHEIAHPPISLASRIAARLKIMSQLDISERRIPQDGRFKMTLSRRHAIDFRVSICPTIAGEKVVMRILDPTAATLGLDALGMNEQQRDAFNDAINQPQGMVLVTGPTGSGKTVTLYTALSMLNTKERNISTAEDPVELKMVGVNQVNVNKKTGFTFSAALRSFLRQDPDVIMVGEMRDLETAEIGIKAAQTGHLVLSTLHTNSAPETLSRLLNMGLEPYNIAGSVSLIIAQRLARRLCNKCKEETIIPKEILIKQGFPENAQETGQIYKAVGCSHCTNGYKGRLGLYEVLVVTPTIAELIIAGAKSKELAKAALAEGMITIKQSGIEKVMAGLTTIEEVNRVTKD